MCVLIQVPNNLASEYFYLIEFLKASCAVSHI